MADKIDLNENEELDDKLLSQALPVVDLKKDADLTKPPIDGFEYLSRVRFVKLILLIISVLLTRVIKFNFNIDMRLLKLLKLLLVKLI